MTTTTSSINKLQGTYLLTALFDENGTSLEIPSTSNDGGFQIMIDSESSDESSTTSYTVVFKLGNVLRTQMTIAANSQTVDDETAPVTAEFGPVMSTRMLPPPEIYKLEVTATQHVFRTNPCYVQYNPATTLLSIASATTQGKIECRLITK